MDVYTLPSGLTVPADDGAADYLRGAVVLGWLRAERSTGAA
jgi:hypothetical protein